MVGENFFKVCYYSNNNESNFNIRRNFNNYPNSFFDSDCWWLASFLIKKNYFLLKYIGK